MPQAKVLEVHQTRQRTQDFIVSSTLLAAGAGVFTDSRRAKGWNSLCASMRSNVAGRIRVFQSMDDVNWILTEEAISSADAVSGEEVAFLADQIVMEYARVEFTNTSGAPQTAFTPAAFLVPIGTAGGGGGGGGFSAAVRNFDTNADVDEALLGVVTNTRNAYRDIGLADWAMGFGDILSTVIGAGGRVTTAIGAPYSLTVNGGVDTAGADVWRPVEARSILNFAGASTDLIGLLSMSMCGGIDTTGAAVIRPVEARVATGIHGLALSGFLGLLTNSLGFVAEVASSQRYLLGGTAIADSSTTTAAAYTTDVRESGWSDMVRGRRFSITHQTPGTLTTAQAAFVATTPTVLIRNASGSATIVGRTINITAIDTLAAPILVTLAIDTADRLNTGGTAVTPQNWDESSATAYPGTNVLYNPTATAAGAGTRYLMTVAILPTSGQSVTISLKDGVRIVGTGSILVYVYDSAGLAGPDVIPNIEVEAFA